MMKGKNKILIFIKLIINMSLYNYVSYINVVNNLHAEVRSGLDLLCANSAVVY